ncbi:hypothetical protein D3C85_1281320 [compost metagenome]
MTAAKARSPDTYPAGIDVISLCHPGEHFSHVLHLLVGHDLTFGIATAFPKITMIIENYHKTSFGKMFSKLINVQFFYGRKPVAHYDRCAWMILVGEVG